MGLFGEGKGRFCNSKVMKGKVTKWEISSKWRKLYQNWCSRKRYNLGDLEVIMLSCDLQIGNCVHADHKVKFLRLTAQEHCNTTQITKLIRMESSYWTFCIISVQPHGHFSINCLLKYCIPFDPNPCSADILSSASH